MSSYPSLPGSYVPHTPLEKHCAFFDRNKDGIVTPWETWEGMRALGYGLGMALLGTVVVHLALSYPTLDTWIPDPFFTIHLRNIHRCRHGTDTGVYDDKGGVRRERAEYLLSMYTRPVFVAAAAGSSSGSATGPVGSSSSNSNSSLPRKGMGLWEGLRMIYDNRCLWDWFGWVAAVVEWVFMFALCSENGIIPTDAIMSQYDGTLFYDMEERRKRKQM
jgi:peroxygenase